MAEGGRDCEIAVYQFVTDHQAQLLVSLDHGRTWQVRSTPLPQLAGLYEEYPHLRVLLSPLWAQLPATTSPIGMPGPLTPLRALARRSVVSTRLRAQRHTGRPAGMTLTPRRVRAESAPAGYPAQPGPRVHPSLTYPARGVLPRRSWTSVTVPVPRSILTSDPPSKWLPSVA